MPDFTLTATTPDPAALAREETRLTRAEIRAETIIAATRFAAVAALFVLDPNRATGEPLVFAICAALLALSHGARIDLAPDAVKVFVRQGILMMAPFRKTEINDKELDALAAFVAKNHKR